MGPNTRPPLTSRIRASFEGKRSHSSDVTSPTGPQGFLTQDPEALRLAIDEAINSSTFQNAIAANLANLIKPSIRDALDTLQPVVEAVYSHDLLLRKTNRSVEDILIRLDTNAEDRQASRRASSEHKDWEDDRPHPLQAHPLKLTENVKSTEDEPTPTNERPDPTPQQATSSPPPDLEQFKQLLDESNAHIAVTLSELTSSLNASNGRLAGVLEGVDSLKAFSEQSDTTTSVMQAQLDQLKADIGEIMDAIGSDLGKNVKSVHEKVAAQDTSLLSSHTTKLDAIATDLGALKGHSDTVEKIEAISTELVALKGAIEASTTANSEGFTSLSGQVSAVLNTIKGHTSTLGEISEKGPHPDIIAALRQSNDHHAAHAIALGEIKERSLATPPTPASTPEGSNPDSTAALQELKADLASLKENIEAGLSSNNENVTGLGSKIDTVLTTIEGHKASDQSGEILAAVQQSNESHAAHATALEGIKSLNVAPEGGNAVLEPQISAIVATLESHTAALDEIKATGGSHTLALESHTAALDEIKATGGSHTTALEGIKSIGGEPAAEGGNAVLEPQIGAIIATLEVHTAALDAIKAAHGSHAEALEGIKSLSAAPAPVADGGNTAELEPQIGAIIATLEAHSAALDEIKTTGGSHATALEGIKAISAPAAESTPTLVPQIGAIIATLESHTAALDEIKGTTTSHTTALEQSRSVDATPAPAPVLDTSHLESQIGDIITTLGVHTSVLDDLKSSHTSSTAIGPTPESPTSEEPLNTILETLNSHTTLLNEIKDDVSAEILTALHDLGQSQVNQDNLLTEIREADVSDEILTALHVSNEAHGNHAVALGKIDSAVKASNEFHTAHASSLDEIKARGIEDTPTPPPVAEGATIGVAALEAQIVGVVTMLEEQNATLATIKEATNASNESHNAHTASLDEIKSRSIEPVATAGEMPSLAPIEEQIGGISKALEEQHGMLSSIIFATTALHEFNATHAASLEELKSRSIEQPPASGEAPSSAALEEKIEGISDKLDDHQGMLSSIIYATTAMHESQAAHVATLEELKSRSVEQPTSTVEPPNFAPLEEKIGGISDKLSEHQGMLSSIIYATTAMHESQGAHVATLEEIRDATTSSREAHASHTTALAEIKEMASASNEADSSHITALSEINDATSASNVAHASHATALTQSTSDITAHLNTIISTLETQTATLDEIKSRPAGPEVMNTITSSHELLTSHTALLESIKEASSHEDILENISALKAIIEESKSEHSSLVKDLHSSTQENHSTLTSALAGIAAGAGTAALVSHSENTDEKEILDKLTVVVEKVESIKSQIEINHTTTTTSITTLSDELKAEIDATGTQINESLTSLDADVQGIDLGPLHDSMVGHGTSLKGLWDKIDAVGERVGGLGEKVDEVREGVSFNEQGVNQLKEHAAVVGEVKPLSEGAWFGSKSRSTSPIVEKKQHEDAEAGFEHEAGPVESGGIERDVVDPESEEELDDIPEEEQEEGESEESEEEEMPEVFKYQVFEETPIGARTPAEPESGVKEEAGGEEEIKEKEPVVESEAAHEAEHEHVAHEVELKEEPVPVEPEVPAEEEVKEETPVPTTVEAEEEAKPEESEVVEEAKEAEPEAPHEVSVEPEEEVKVAEPIVEEEKETEPEPVHESEPIVEEVKEAEPESESEVRPPLEEEETKVEEPEPISHHEEVNAEEPSEPEVHQQEEEKDKDLTGPEVHQQEEAQTEEPEAAEPISETEPTDEAKEAEPEPKNSAPPHTEEEIKAEDPVSEEKGPVVEEAGPIHEPLSEEKAPEAEIEPEPVEESPKEEEIKHAAEPEPLSEEKAPEAKSEPTVEEKEPEPETTEPEHVTTPAPAVHEADLEVPESKGKEPEEPTLTPVKESHSHTAEPGLAVATHSHPTLDTIPPNPFSDDNEAEISTPLDTPALEGEGERKGEDVDA